jgi:hypothetical protein
MMQSFCDLTRVKNRVINTQDTVTTNKVANIRALNVFEYDVPPTFRHPDIKHPRDIGVIEPSGCLSLVSKATLHVRIVTDERDHLNRYGPIQTLVTGSKNSPHPAAADQFLKVEVA